jgi:rare lipoprotein A
LKELFIFLRLRHFIYIKLIWKFLALCSVFALISCASTQRLDYKPTRSYMTASWYGPKFNGRPTSSGERFDMHGHTAAHKTLVFGTKLRVTNPDTDRSVNVVVNDRGPFIRGRDLDLSYGAAKAIGLTGKGVGRVKVEYLGRDMRYVKRIAYQPSLPVNSSVPLTIQVGSFEDRSNAFRLKRGLDIKYSNVQVFRARVKGRFVYRVKVGKFDNRDAAYRTAKELADEGYDTLITSRGM